MNDIDPAKMTEAERQALFASFTRGITPSSPPQQTLANLLAPWMASIQTQRALGFDWKQLAQMCADNLKINLSPRTLETLVRAASKPARSAAGKRRARKSAAQPSAPPAPKQKPDSAS